MYFFRSTGIIGKYEKNQQKNRFFGENRYKGENRNQGIRISCQGLGFGENPSL